MDECAWILDTVIYQQDVVASHYSNASLDYFHRYFPANKLISSHTYHFSPAHTQVLSSLDYFLRAYPKETVFVDNEDQGRLV